MNAPKSTTLFIGLGASLLLSGCLNLAGSEANGGLNDGTYESIGAETVSQDSIWHRTTSQLIVSGSRAEAIQYDYQKTSLTQPPQSEEWTALMAIRRWRGSYRVNVDTLRITYTDTGGVSDTGGQLSQESAVAIVLTPVINPVRDGGWLRNVTDTSFELTAIAPGPTAVWATWIKRL